ncbi:Ribonucleases P/MRP protein subunit POP1-like protein [Drosera capensis]
MIPMIPAQFGLAFVILGTELLFWAAAAKYYADLQCEDVSLIRDDRLASSASSALRPYFPPTPSSTPQHCHGGDPKNWKSTTAPPPPPRTLNVQKLSSSRAAELESLHSIISARVDNDFRSQSNKRRRTNSYMVKKKRGRPRSKGKVEDCDCGEVSNRVKRRRMECIHVPCI